MAYLREINMSNMVQDYNFTRVRHMRISKYTQHDIISIILSRSRSGPQWVFSSVSLLLTFIAFNFSIFALSALDILFDLAQGCPLLKFSSNLLGACYKSSHGSFVYSWWTACCMPTMPSGLAWEGWMQLYVPPCLGYLLTSDPLAIYAHQILLLFTHIRSLF